MQLRINLVVLLRCTRSIRPENELIQDMFFTMSQYLGIKSQLVSISNNHMRIVLFSLLLSLSCNNCIQLFLRCKQCVTSGTPTLVHANKKVRNFFNCIFWTHVGRHAGGCTVTLSRFSLDNLEQS